MPEAGKVELTEIELSTQIIHVRSDVWQQPGGFVWIVWHGLGHLVQADWYCYGVSPDEDGAYDAMRDAVVAAFRAAGADIPDEPKEVRIITPHYDA